MPCLILLFLDVCGNFCQLLHKLKKGYMDVYRGCNSHKIVHRIPSLDPRKDFVLLVKEKWGWRLLSSFFLHLHGVYECSEDVEEAKKEILEVMEEEWKRQFGVEVSNNLSTAH